jgi:hypothetical protein
MQPLDEITAMDVVGFRFKKNVRPQQYPPADSVRICAFDQGPLVPVDEEYPETWEKLDVPDSYQDSAGIATHIPPSLTDRNATWQWMGVFLWNLNLFPSHPAVEYVGAVFQQILELPMYLRGEIPQSMHPRPDRPYYMAGRPVPMELLNQLVAAAEKVHDLVIGSSLELPRNQRPESSTNTSKANDTSEPGVTLFDAAMFFEDGDDKAARSLVRRWHDQNVVPEFSVGKCPTDARARLYRLLDVVEKVAGISNLNRREQSRLTKHLTARLRLPRPE